MGAHVGAGHRADDHPAAPMSAESLRDLPPALILTAEVDPIRDDAEAYAARLRHDGVPVSLTRYDGVFHGFVTEVGVFAQTKQAIDEVCLHLREVARAWLRGRGRVAAEGRSSICSARARSSVALPVAAGGATYRPRLPTGWSPFSVAIRVARPCTPAVPTRS
ncbi:hypothetical protein GCM10023094_51080 [Rhodococcus olei]|uniref:Alpha/beta hydrolase fold-3 domain-containing protein n=2 Tax=Rhodococcus olei TaxID=2161675 RepID=A0ABP8PN21_9NOCA